MTRIRPSILLTSLAFLLSGAALLASPVAAQSSEERSVLDGVYSPEQANFGQEVYEAECALCHTTQEFTGRIFLLSWSNRSVHDLLRSIRSTMPFDRPGGLTDEQYTAIVSYLLKLNEYPAGEEEMESSEEVLSQIKIEPPSNQ